MFLIKFFLDEHLPVFHQFVLGWTFTCIFSGNRGITLSRWNNVEFASNLLDERISQIEALNSTDATYNGTKIIGQSSFDDNAEKYATRMEGYFVPPRTGQYQFKLRADDFSRFYLSTDESESNGVSTAALPRRKSEISPDKYQDLHVVIEFQLPDVRKFSKKV